MTFEMAMAQAFLRVRADQDWRGIGNYYTRTLALRRLRVRAGLTP